MAERCQTDVNTKLRLKYQPYYHVIERAEGANIWIGGKKMIMMSSNEYLGLSSHPKVKESVKKAVDKWGTSSCGSRLANGTRTYHIELEEALAEFVGKEACHVLTAGYLACMASLSSIAQRDDALIVDKSIHSSLWDGVRVSAATVERFTHEDMNSLKAILEQLDSGQPKIIAVDGVYSMEGHIASLPKIVELAKQYPSFLVVDDAHGFGVLGKDGRGVVDHFGVTKEVDLIVGTFSKSLVSTGGFIAGDRGVIEYLRSSARQIIFSAAITPAASAAAMAALKIMQEEPQHRERVWENTRYMQNILKNLGLDYWNSPTPAIPIVIGSKEKCYYLWKHLWEHGFFTVMSISPGVPVGKDLIRTAVSAYHTKEQLDKFGSALASAIKKVGIKTNKN
ncbi:MAG: aminotransferase class I/II-fold pyridoxal phosphate-dependent enzyme [Verrucomicrobiota bacterium]